MITYSQFLAFQDLFANFINKNKSNGFVIDIGCKNKIGSNSLLFLEKGWTCRGADISNYTDEWKDYPKFFYQMDVSIKQNIDILFKNAPSVIEFLSIDVDDASLQTLLNIDFLKFKFKCICFEHDYYAHGEKLRIPQRKILEKNGYNRVIQTASEDWWVYNDLIDKDIIEILEKIPEHKELVEHEMPIILKWLNLENND
jgi:hypothetical protein